MPPSYSPSLISGAREKRNILLCTQGSESGSGYQVYDIYWHALHGETYTSPLTTRAVIRRTSGAQKPSIKKASSNIYKSSYNGTVMRRT